MVVYISPAAAAAQGGAKPGQVVDTTITNPAFQQAQSFQVGMRGIYLAVCVVLGLLFILPQASSVQSSNYGITKGQYLAMSATDRLNYDIAVHNLRIYGGLPVPNGYTPQVAEIERLGLIERMKQLNASCGVK